MENNVRNNEAYSGLGLTRIKRATATEAVLEQVKGLILEQKFQPGEKLPSERVLSEMTGVSRPSLREAFKTLEALGIIEIRHGSGVFVREPSLDFATFPITVMLSKDKEIIEELIEARQIVEVEVVALAARKAAPENLRELEDFLNKRETADEIRNYEGKFDFEFEKLVARSVGNRILMSIQEATHTLWDIGIRKAGMSPLPVGMIIQEHRRIFEAIKSRDENMARLEMIYHLRGPLRRLIQD